jgi:hypothetical protein
MRIKLGPAKAQKRVRRMCGLCGILGVEGDWTEPKPSPSAAQQISRRAQRHLRVLIVNGILQEFGLALADWESTRYQLSNRTGRIEIVDNLPQVWQAAERILGRACDPLDSALLAKLQLSERLS